METVIAYFVFGWIILTALENIPEEWVMKWFNLGNDGPPNIFVDFLILLLWPLMIVAIIALFRWEKIGAKNWTLFPKFRNK